MLKIKPEQIEYHMLFNLKMNWPCSSDEFSEPLPWFSPGKSRSRKVSEQIFPSAAAGDSCAAAGISAHHQG